MNVPDERYYPMNVITLWTLLPDERYYLMNVPDERYYLMNVPDERYSRNDPSVLY